MTVQAAHKAALTAKAGVTQAEAALSEALDARDRALAAADWRGLLVTESLNRARSRGSDLRDSPVGARRKPGPGGAAGPSVSEARATGRR
jgi:hypothetical protein